LPPGLAVNPATGVISGVPTTAGTYTADVVGTNAAGTGETADMTITVLPAATAPVVNSISYATGRVGVAFNYQITASNSPVSFDVLQAPSWMAVSPASGAISGTPTSPGTFQVQLDATNSAGTSSPLALTIAISPATGTPVVVSTQTATGEVSQPFSFQITATATPTSYTVSTLPAGLTFNSVTGVISGTPAASGTFPITVYGSNGFGQGAPVTLFLVLAPDATLSL